MQQQANLATLRAAEEQDSLLMRLLASRQQADAEQAQKMAELRFRSGDADLDRALRAKEIGLKERQLSNEAEDLSLGQLRDPDTGKLVGYSYGKTARWAPEEIPSEGIPLKDQAGNVLAHRFGPRVIPVAKDRALTQGELDYYMLHPELDPRRAKGPATTNAPAKKRYRIVE